MKQIELLLTLLNKTADKATRAIILQTFVQSYGPVPDKYADDVRKALERQDEARMTNEQAISRIEDHIRVHALSEPRADLIHVALRMAIEALKQPEIVHCKECLYKEICSWKREGAKFCSFGERGEAE